jgi:putative endonuclease
MQNSGRGRNKESCRQGEGGIGFGWSCVVCLLELKIVRNFRLDSIFRKNALASGTDSIAIGYLMMRYFVYLMASRRNGVLYTGITSNIVKRVWEHKNGSVEGFTKKYDVNKLVYYEIFEDVEEAILRERRIKKWNRGWKIRLIESLNPEWKDLYEDII